MNAQDIFKNFGNNWKWASMSSAGGARLHTKRPTFNAGALCYNSSSEAMVRCEAFDLVEVPADGGCESILTRTDFTNGPAYPTDRFGAPLCPQPATVAAQMPAPQAVQLSVEEAENGGLWEHANNYENYVSVNTFGVVWFNCWKDGPSPRRSYSVEVTGATHYIERTRSEGVDLQEPGKPFAQPVAPHFDYQPGLRDDGLEPPEDEAHGWADGAVELEKKLNRQRRVYKKAKVRAKALLDSYNADGSQQLTIVQYMAIFGEQP